MNDAISDSVNDLIRYYADRYYDMGMYASAEYMMSIDNEDPSDFDIGLFSKTTFKFKGLTFWGSDIDHSPRINIGNKWSTDFEYSYEGIDSRVVMMIHERQFDKLEDFVGLDGGFEIDGGIVYAMKDGTIYVFSDLPL